MFNDLPWYLDIAVAIAGIGAAGSAAIGLFGYTIISLIRFAEKNL